MTEKISTTLSIFALPVLVMGFVKVLWDLAHHENVYYGWGCFFIIAFTIGYVCMKINKVANFKPRAVLTALTFTDSDDIKVTTKAHSAIECHQRYLI